MAYTCPGNARVVGQKELERFRSELSSKVGDAFTVVLRDKKLPLALLNDHQKVSHCNFAGLDLTLFAIATVTTVNTEEYCTDSPSVTPAYGMVLTQKYYTCALMCTLPYHVLQNATCHC